MLSQEQRQRIRDLRAQGLTYNAIAEQVGCSHSAVPYILNLSSESPFARKKMTIEQQQQIIDLHKAGKSVIEISKILGINAMTIYRYRNLDAPEEVKHKPMAESWARIQELQAKGLDYKQIAKRMDITPDRVKQIVCFYTGSGADINYRVRRKQDVLSVTGSCRICSADIVIEIDNKPDMYQFSLRWGQRYVDCPQCGQTFQADCIVSKAEVERLWWAQLLQDDESSLEIE